MCQILLIFLSFIVVLKISHYQLVIKVHLNNKALSPLFSFFPDLMALDKNRTFTLLMMKIIDYLVYFNVLNELSIKKIF